KRVVDREPVGDEASVAVHEHLDRLDVAERLQGVEEGARFELAGADDAEHPELAARLRTNRDALALSHGGTFAARARGYKAFRGVRLPLGKRRPPGFEAIRLRLHRPIYADDRGRPAVGESIHLAVGDVCACKLRELPCDALRADELSHR